MRRKSDFNATGETVRDRAPEEHLPDYGVMTPDELIDHFIDDHGLVAFIDVQQKGIPFEEWNWRDITLHLQGFSRGYLTFSPEYLEELYDIQATRQRSLAT